jgi:hypothetical protein
MVKVLLPRHDDLLREGHVHRRLVRTHTVLVDAREEVVVGRVQVKPLVSERAVELCLVLPLLVDRVFEAVVVGVRLIAAFIPSKAVKGEEKNQRYGVRGGGGSSRVHVFT